MSDSDNNVMVVRLDPASLDDLADRVADLVGHRLAAPPEHRPGAAEEHRLLTAAQVAERWNVDRSWVYDHADQLGARRLGNGKRPRLRFDPAEVAAYLEPAAPEPGADDGTRSSERDVRRSPSIPSDTRNNFSIRATQRYVGHATARRPSGRS